MAKHPGHSANRARRARSGCEVARQAAMDRGVCLLEVIDKGSPTESHPAPLLFVHCAAHAAWCWDIHFLDFFVDNGYRALALSLRGHGGSPVSGPLNKCTIADYVDDVRSVAETLPVTPVLIGHSMGGFIVQKYLEAAAAPAAVLVSSAPPRSFFVAELRVSRNHPGLAYGPRHDARTRMAGRGRTNRRLADHPRVMRLDWARARSRPSP
jgi:pimeloyl-ACP methyl ester carboxylesterase